MSRSVSAPSSVTKTSPCWNGLIVPGSTFRYGSNFWAKTSSPRALSSRPSDAATIPLPSAETTPPVTKTYLGARALTGFEGSRASGRPLRPSRLGGGLDEVVEPRERVDREAPAHGEEGRVDDQGHARPRRVDRRQLDLRVEPLAGELERDPAHRHHVENEERAGGVGSPKIRGPVGTEHLP